EPALRLALGVRRIRIPRLLDGPAWRAAVRVHARPTRRRPADLSPGSHEFPGRDRRPLALDPELQIRVEAEAERLICSDVYVLVLCWRRLDRKAGGAASVAQDAIQHALLAGRIGLGRIV